ncbi:hypothetical protein EYF80_001762 [Liparis tanakae]|uniref:Uncharacterized protein n=1 Tax=Liparis tanakae TaxID=230148 RepID=A0A4Z2JDS4_9TELE|nr:hypothetical protein EYF80_001762 [Liparis tanakae]
MGTEWSETSQGDRVLRATLALCGSDGLMTEKLVKAIPIERLQPHTHKGHHNITFSSLIRLQDLALRQQTPYVHDTVDPLARPAVPGGVETDSVGLGRSEAGLVASICVLQWSHTDHFDRDSMDISGKNRGTGRAVAQNMRQRAGNTGRRHRHLPYFPLIREIPITASFLARDESVPSFVPHMDSASLIQGEPSEQAVAGNNRSARVDLVASHNSQGQDKGLGFRKTGPAAGAGLAANQPGQILYAALVLQVWEDYRPVQVNI